MGERELVERWRAPVLGDDRISAALTPCSVHKALIRIAIMILTRTPFFFSFSRYFSLSCFVLEEKQPADDVKRYVSSMFAKQTMEKV